MKVERRNEDNDLVATVHSYAPGDGTLAFVARDPRTNEAVGPSPNREECEAVLPHGWVLVQRGNDWIAKPKVLKTTPEQWATWEGKAAEIQATQYPSPYWVDVTASLIADIKVLHAFYNAVADLTVNHEHAIIVQNDKFEEDAVVYPKALGKVLETVDPDWYNNV
jgi:hypothetical protein